MSPDDARHGEYRGAVQHWHDRERPCAPCQRAATRYAKERKLDQLRGRARSVSAIGVRRRVQALAHIGWSLSHIADRMGCRRTHVHRMTRQHRVGADQAAQLAAVYDDLCMTPGPSNRSRADAARNGWPPPSAWLDIDDPDEQPDPGWQPRLYTAAELAAEWDHLRTAGESIEQAAKSLGVSVAAIEKACERARKAVA